MQIFEYTILDDLGIHARPAGAIVKLSKNYESMITVAYDEASADGRKLMALMGLGITKGSKVRITANGKDEEIAIEALKKYFEENL